MSAPREPVVGDGVEVVVVDRERRPSASRPAM
jgi:hypothetical protein